MISIDGSMGEGGGQVLRTSLALSLLTGTAFEIQRIRAGRSKPGLMRQHLVAVQAAARIGNAQVSGAEVGSTSLVFRPRGIQGGTYEFPIGSAGSTTLVFQTVLFPLLLGAKEPSTVRFEGGTHNPMAPPLDFLRSAYAPLLARMGARFEIAFERYGFYPAGGGAWSATIHPASHLERLDLLERGEIRAQRGNAIVAQIPSSVALRELDTLTEALGWTRADSRPTVVPNPHGPGNALVATLEGEHVTEVFSGIGERGVRAERVAQGVADEISRYLRAGVPVFEHLADQLLLPLALGSGGSFRTVTPSTHFSTQSDLLKTFLDVEVRAVEESEDVWRIDVERKRSN